MRPDWDQYFMGLAFVASQRSRDTSTKHGCVAVDEDNRVIGMGYNSFPEGMEDSIMPQQRPDRHFSVTHSEVNCLINCVAPTKGATLYVTGRPCSNCLSTIKNARIKRIVAADRRCYTNTIPEEIKAFDLILSQSKIDYDVIKPDLTWLNNLNT